MSDPFDSLFSADGPIAPSPTFSTQLQRRMLDELYDAIAQSGGPTMTGTATSTDSTPINSGCLFYFTVPAADPDRAAAFFGELFGWQLSEGNHGYHVSNVYPPMGIATNDNPTPQVWIEVENIESAVAKVRELGGTAEDPSHNDSGWVSQCTDPQGVVFNLSVPTESYRQPARSSSEPGELFYWTLPAPDAAASKRFFGTLFGWEFDTPGSAGGMHIENIKPDGGLGGGREGTHPEVFFRVTNLEVAAAKVRALGGTAELVGGGEEGEHAMCTDDQGVTFGISQPAAGY